METPGLTGASTVTLQTIADECGLSRMAVSLGLRGSPKIPLETQRRIKATAKKLGYKKDPLVTALMTRLVSLPRQRHLKSEYPQRKLAVALQAIMDAQKGLPDGATDAAVREVRKLLATIERRKRGQV